MSNSSKTQDSYQSCYSSIFENSQDSESDSIQDTLNSKVFLIPSTINDIWLLEQIHQFKVSNSNKSDQEYLQSNEEYDNYRVNDISSDSQVTYSEDISINSYPRLSDIIKNKLFLDRQQNPFVEEDDYIINELVKELSLHTLNNNEINEGDILLTQDEIDEIKEILSQEC